MVCQLTVPFPGAAHQWRAGGQTGAGPELLSACPERQSALHSAPQCAAQPPVGVELSQRCSHPRLLGGPYTA